MSSKTSSVFNSDFVFEDAAAGNVPVRPTKRVSSLLLINVLLILIYIFFKYIFFQFQTLQPLKNPITIIEEDIDEQEIDDFDGENTEIKKNAAKEKRSKKADVNEILKKQGLIQFVLKRILINSK
jgi:regulatory protein YycI of two-component signal transduction system YycFG